MPFKYRLNVNQCDTQKQILSIEEKRDGTTLIYFPAMPFMAFEDVIIPKPLNNKFTIHLSTNSIPAGNTITHEVLCKDGNFHRGHAHIINNEEGDLIWPIVTKSLGYEEMVYQQRSRHSNDNFHYLPSYDVKNQLMIISLVGFSAKLPKLAIYPLRCVHLGLSKFSIAVYYYVVSLPSYRNSLQRVGYTSSVLGVGSDDSNFNLIRQNSLTAEQLATYLKDDFDYIIQRNVGKSDHPVRQ